MTAGDAEEEQDRDAIKAKALDLVEAEPDTYSKTSLGKALGGNTQAGLGVVGEMIANGTLGPNKDRAKLHVSAASLLEPGAG